MIPVIYEVRAMIEAGRRYLAGDCNICELNGYASHCAQTARIFQADPAIEAAALEWQFMINRRWNEWGFAKDPLTEAEFRDWLSAQIMP